MLKTLSFDHRTNRYSIISNGVRYFIEIEQVYDLKNYFRKNQNASVEEWYSKLSDTIRSQVQMVDNSYRPNGFDYQRIFE